MQTIHKYPLGLQKLFALKLPEGAQLLTAQAQDGDAFLWALVDPNAREEGRVFRLACTGDEIEEASGDLQYVGTFRLRDGGLVYHLFEIIKKRKKA